MASREVVDVSSSDDEFKEPPRMPIGWNYQLGTSKCVKTKSRANGAAAATALAAPASASHHSAEDSDDDLEIIEVKVEPQSKKASLPPSSSRTEIRRQVRNTTQSSISNFFNKSPKGEKGSNKESKVKDEKTVKTTTTNTSEKDDLKKEEERWKKEEEVLENEEEDDKSPATMEAFMSRWEEIKPLGKDDKKIRDKLWKYYHLAYTSYTHSKKFIQIVETSINKLTIDNIYVVIKDILDCLKRYKDTPYREKLSGEESAATSREGTPAPIEVEDTKTNKKLRKVDKMMKEIAAKIKDLESQEVDLDDEVNSTYLVEERLKRQFTKLHSYYCRLANCSPATGRPTEKKFKFRGSRWQEINKRVTAWVNKHKEFPDYTDILNLVKKVTKQSSLPLRPETVRVQAQEIFRDVGKMLKYRRESDDLYSIYSYVDEDGEDPAKEDEELNNKLSENEKIAQENLNKIFQDYVDKDAKQPEEADKATNEDETSKSPVKRESDSQDPSRSAESQEGESSKVDGKEREEVSAVAKEIQGVVKSDTDTCRQSDLTASNKNEGGEGEEEEEEEEDSLDDMAQDTGGEDEEGTSDEDDATEDEEEEEESEATKEQTSSGAKKEGELDEADETDDELKDVLASACRDEEEEEDSEEDIPVLDSEELLVLEEFRSTNHKEVSSNVCLDDENKKNGPSTATSKESKYDGPSTATPEEGTATPTSTMLHNSENDSSVPTSNKSPALAASNAHSSPSSTTTADMAEPHQKRQLEDGSSPACKKLCL